MFEKLLAALPYNPGLAHQMGFYARRMHEEATIRRTGLIFLVLTFMVQFFAVLSPPQLTLASGDTNDMIEPNSSGLALSAAHPRTDAYDACSQDVRGYGDALSTFGVSCQSLLSADVVDVVSTSSNQNGPLYSMGYHSYGAVNPDSGLKTDEQAFTVEPGGRTIYARQLHSFDTHGSSTYVHSLRVTSSTGQTVYILSTCGNMVTFGLPKMPAKPAPAPAAPASTPPATPSTPPPTDQCPNIPGNQDSSNNCDVCPDNAGIQLSTSQCFTPCQYNASLHSDDVNCKPCDASVSSQDTLACVTISKTATNVTAGITNADGTTANPGDVITYTLYAQNKGKAAVKQYIFTEDISDVLDYAGVTDLHGGTIDSNGIVTWPVQSIDAGTTASHQITVQVKNPIPSTPVDPTNSMRFDLTMTNVYGNAVNIKVPSPPVKSIQTTAAALPNTGPGDSLFIAAAVVMVAGYFYGRARLLARESELALKQSTSA